jgi:hypothetical protein
MPEIYAGDLKPDLSISLTNHGAPLDLTSAVSIRIIGKRRSDGSIAFDRSPTTQDKVNGVVTMAWQTADTATADELLIEVEVTWPGTKPQTFHPSGVVRVRPAYA